MIHDACDKPLAAVGLTSYRYKGTYGWIMIGAKDHDDALREAARSAAGEIVNDNLQVWDGEKYVSAYKKCANFNDFDQVHRYGTAVDTRLVLALPITDFRPEAMRVTERKLDRDTWFEVETFSENLGRWIDQKSHLVEFAAVSDALGWYPEPATILMPQPC